MTGKGTTRSATTSLCLKTALLRFVFGAWGCVLTVVFLLFCQGDVPAFLAGGALRAKQVWARPAPEEELLACKAPLVFQTMEVRRSFVRLFVCSFVLF